MNSRRRLITSAEAVPQETQHTSPCSDCPWRRDSLSGWLGGATPDAWLATAHSDTYVPCHTVGNQQCAGVAVYRRNTCKHVEPPLLTLPADKTAVFAWRDEFTTHHSRGTP